MSLKVQAVNLALIRIGHSRTITNLEEQSREAFTAAAVIDHEFKSVLRQFPWPFATKYLALAVRDGTELVATNSDWQYAYDYPADCLFARRVLTPGVRREFDDAPMTFRVGRLVDRKVIYTNLEDAELEYTAIFDCPEHMGDELFVDAFAWRIAAALAPSLSRIVGMGQTALQMYVLALDAAAAVASKEGQPDPAGEAEWIRAR